MKRVEINVNGKAFPCGPTMGAMLRFKQETGREITEINASSFSDLCTYLWCCVVSASRREGLEFTMTLMDFADSISPEDMTEWNEAIMASASDADGKKKATAPKESTN